MSSARVVGLAVQLAEHLVLEVVVLEVLAGQRVHDGREAQHAARLGPQRGVLAAARVGLLDERQQVARRRSVWRTLQEPWLSPTLATSSRAGSSPATSASSAGKTIGPSQSETNGTSLWSVTAWATMLTGFV